MKEFLKALSGRAEFLIVVLGAFGLFLLSNLILLFDPSALASVPPITNEQLQQTVYYEIVALTVLGAFLHAGNGRWSDWASASICVTPSSAWS